MARPDNRETATARRTRLVSNAPSRKRVVATTSIPVDDVRGARPLCSPRQTDRCPAFIGFRRGVDSEAVIANQHKPSGPKWIRLDVRNLLDRVSQRRAMAWAPHRLRNQKASVGW